MNKNGTDFDDPFFHQHIHWILFSIFKSENTLMNSLHIDPCTFWSTDQFEGSSHLKIGIAPWTFLCSKSGYLNKNSPKAYSFSSNFFAIGIYISRHLAIFTLEVSNTAKIFGRSGHPQTTYIHIMNTTRLCFYYV